MEEEWLKTRIPEAYLVVSKEATWEVACSEDNKFRIK